MNSMGRFHASPPAAWARWPVQSRPDVLPRAPERARILPRKTWALKIVGNSCGCLGKNIGSERNNLPKDPRWDGGVGIWFARSTVDKWAFELGIPMNIYDFLLRIYWYHGNLGNIVSGYLMGIWCEHWVYHEIVNLPIEDILGIYLSIFPGEIVETWDILYQN